LQSIATGRLDSKSGFRAILHGVTGLAAVLFVTWLAFLLRLNMAAAGFLQLLVVVVVASKAGFWEATAASILANLCLNYFFIKPLFTLYVPDTRDWVALIVFEVVALLVSRLSAEAQKQAARAVSHERELERLYELARTLLAVDVQQSQSAAIVTPLQKIFSLEQVVIFDAPKAQAVFAGNFGGELEVQTRDAYLTQCNRDASAPAGTWFRVLRVGVRAVGSIGLRGSGLTAATVNAIAWLTAIALERTHSLERETQAQAERRSEELRTTVLDALAHEYKTPLTVVRTATTGLMEIGALNGIALELIALIDSEISRLARLTDNLLQTARLDRAEVRIRPEQIDLSELMRDAIMVRQSETPQRKFDLQGAHGKILIRADRELVTLALSQYLDNAAKYSDPADPIVVSIQQLPECIRIGVKSSGPPIPESEKRQLFERFYRGAESSHRASGTGIGLSVTKKVAAVHSGRVWVSSDTDGNTFFLELPRLMKN
jgi:two-component system sensor histidine kinase KdpD